MSRILRVENDVLDTEEDVTSLSKEELKHFCGEICPQRLIFHHAKKLFLR